MLAMVPLADSTLTHPFWIFNWDEVLAPHVFFCSIALFLSGVLCSAAGIGGGGVYVAVLMVIGSLSPHNAVPLSKAVVWFGAMATLAMNFRRMQGNKANKKGSVIDFHAVRITVPAALIGTFLGVAMNWHTSGGTIVVVLAALLSFMTLTVGQKAWQQYCDEQRDDDMNNIVMSNLDMEHASEGGEDAPLIPKIKEMTVVKFKAQENTFTSRDVALTSTLLVSVVISGVLRFHMRACEADILNNSAQDSCSHPVMQVFGGRMKLWMSNPQTAWFMQNGLMASSLVQCVFAAAFYSSYTHQTAGWSAKDITTYQTMGVATGLLAGLVGVGGGLIFSPFFLVMGMDPAVAVATSSTCVLFTSSSTTVQYILTDRVIMPLALVYGLVTLGASLAGTSLVHHLQDSCKGRRSYISFIVAIAVALSAVLALIKFFRMIGGFDL